jgi:hypothetical protein
MNPKTGTSTLRVLFKNLINETLYYHTRFHELPEYYNDYRTFCFYRDPVDRFISGYSYLLQTYKTNLLEDITPDAPARLGLNSMGCNNLENITPDVVLDAKEHNKQGFVLDILDYQSEWVGNSEILDFNNFNTECSKLSKLFGMDSLNAIQINSSNHIKLTSSQIKRVENYYKEDYIYR